MTSDKDKKIDKKKESKEEKSDTDFRCCYVVDPCGCYVSQYCC
jgi:hypothetical protein